MLNEGRIMATKPFTSRLDVDDTVISADLSRVVFKRHTMAYLAKAWLRCLRALPPITQGPFGLQTRCHEVCLASYDIDGRLSLPSMFPRACRNGCVCMTSAQV